MPRARDPNRDKAFELWKKSKGEMKLRDIAKHLDVPEKTVSGWKSKDKWEDLMNGVLHKNVRSTPNKKTSKRKSPKVEVVIPEPVIQNDELTDKQKYFCLHYLKYFNATKAYQKAYG
ncbi:phage terminase small subunit-related protein, partial [Escherichia coli]|nr:phage terminase small subunit-related protein [Escherichia coli]